MPLNPCVLRSWHAAGTQWKQGLQMGWMGQLLLEYSQISYSQCFPQTFLYPSIGLSEPGKEQADPNSPTLLQYYEFSKTPMHSYLAVFGLFVFRDRVSGWLQTHVWSSCLSECWCYRSRLPYLAPPWQSELSFFFLNLNEYLAKLNSCCRSAVSSLPTNASTI